jgi:hypothetical protein
MADGSPCEGTKHVALLTQALKNGVFLDGNTFSNIEISRRNGITLIKINVICLKARHSHDGPGENTTSLVLHM